MSTVVFIMIIDVKMSINIYEHDKLKSVELIMKMFYNYVFFIIIFLIINLFYRVGQIAFPGVQNSIPKETYS